MPVRDSDSDYCVCPHCGEDLPQHATFCRECGASDQSGWNEEDAWDDPEPSDLDDSDFDYDEFIAREFPDQAERHAGLWSFKWSLAAAVAVLLIALLLLGTVF